MKHSLAITSATGTAQKRTIPALENSDKVNIIAVQSRDQNKLASLTARWANLTAYTSVEDMFKNLDVDIAYIASPPFLHKEQIYFAAKYGKPIICEKPLATTLSDAIQIKEIVDEAKVPFMLAHHIRHQPAIQKIKDILNNRILGEERISSFQWSFPVSMNAASSAWKFDIQNGLYHSFYDAGVHAIDLAIYFWGMPDYLYACGDKILEKDMYDTVTATLKYKNHTLILHASLAQSTVGNDLRIGCANGIIEAKSAFSENSIRKVSILQHNNEVTYDYGPLNLYGAEVENFCDNLENDISSNVGTTLTESITAIYILEAIKKSLLSKSIVYLNASENTGDIHV